MRRYGPVTTRWSDRAAGGTLPEDRAAEMFRSAQPLAEPSAVALSRIHARIREQLAPRPRLGVRAGWKVLIALLAIVAVEIGAVALVRKLSSWAEIRPAPPPALKPISVAAPESPPPPTLSTPATPAPSKPSSVRLKAKRKSDLVVRQQESPPPAPADSDLSKESQLLRAAIARLERRDASGALRDLDQHRAQFPDGVLTEEASVLRVNALLAVGRRAEALLLLEHLERGGLDRFARAPELRILHAELLAEGSRCSEALPLFESSLAPNLEEPIRERALYGRASCRAAVGNHAGSREDMIRYLQLYPRGRFAHLARDANP